MPNTQDSSDLKDQIQDSSSSVSQFSNENSLFNAEEWLEQRYPKDGVCQVDEEKTWDDEEESDEIHHPYNNYGKQRKEIIYLELEQNNLEGVLDLSAFSNLQYLSCWENQLTELIIPQNSSLKGIYCSDNQLTSLNVNDCLNLNLLSVNNNQLTSLSISNCVNLTDLYIGNDDDWVKQRNPDNHDNLIDQLNKGNQIVQINQNDKTFQVDDKCNKFTISFASLQNLTKLENLHIWNLPLQSDFQYLPNSLQEIRCTGQIEEELQLYGYNLTLWQAYHSDLMRQVGKEIVRLTDQQLVAKKEVSVHPSWFEDREVQQNPLLESKQEDFNHSSQFNYSSFLVKDIHPFNWESGVHLNNKESQLPLRLYNLETKKVIDSKDDPNINNYLILSYCWGNKWENTPQSYGQDYTTDLTKLGRKALNKLQATYQFLKEQHDLNIDHIWIDNFCINQSDVLEKNREVAKQREYYSNATATFIAIDAKVGDEIDQSDQEKFMIHLAKKIIHSVWFTRAWTFQEGVLSKQAIFMFDDYLVDGRKLALWWGGWSSWTYNRKPCRFITPFGWSAGNQVGKSVSLASDKSSALSLDENVNLNLGEVLFAVNQRNQTVLIDKIYSILGLLFYGGKVKVEYKNDYKVEDLENKLIELIDQAYRHNQKEIMTYWGERNSKYWWLPIIDENGSFQIERSLNYDERADQHYFNQIKQITKQGIQLRGHWTIQEDQHIIELDLLDRRDNTLWDSTPQFTINSENKVITIKKVWEFYYSHGKQQPTELFLDMINFQVIEGESKIKEYLQSLETENQLTDQFHAFQIQN